MNKSKVSVIMSVYNDYTNLSKSIRSILNQTHNNFEFIIINDGSNIKTKLLLKKFESLDKRIKVFENKKKSGLAYSLNIALNKSKYDLVARMDSDDISHRDRLKKQTNFFYSNPKTVILGTNAKIINDKGVLIQKSELPTRHTKIKNKIFFYNTIFHSSVMFKKRNIMKINSYDTNFKKCQDYDLWLRAVKKNFIFSNLKEFLIYYRKKDYYSIDTFKYTILALHKNLFEYNLKIFILSFIFNFGIFFKNIFKYLFKS